MVFMLIGMSILKRYCIEFMPSRSATSAKERGIVRKCCTNKNEPVADARNGTITEAYVLVHSNPKGTGAKSTFTGLIIQVKNSPIEGLCWEIRSNSPIAIRSVGMYNVTSMPQKISAFPGNLKNTSTAAAKIENTVFPMVIEVVMIKVFII